MTASKRTYPKPPSKETWVSESPPFVLIDTSVWIEFFRRKGSPPSQIVRALMMEGQAALAGPVIGELIQGAKTEKELKEIEGLLGAVPHLVPTSQTWQEAGRLSYTLRQKGITVHLLDCYLARLTIEHGASILSLDEHFSLIRRHSSLKLFGR